jgi:hypothetical protein
LKAKLSSQSDVSVPKESHAERLARLQREGYSEECVKCVRTCEDPHHRRMCFVPCNTFCKKPKKESLGDVAWRKEQAKSLADSYSKSESKVTTFSDAGWIPWLAKQNKVKSTSDSEAKVQSDSGIIPWLSKHNTVKTQSDANAEWKARVQELRALFEK